LDDAAEVVEPVADVVPGLDGCRPARGCHRRDLSWDDQRMDMRVYVCPVCGEPVEDVLLGETRRLIGSNRPVGLHIGQVNR
jgi:uncharacterized protein (UPF0212 family)